MTIFETGKPDGEFEAALRRMRAADPAFADQVQKTLADFNASVSAAYAEVQAQDDKEFAQRKALAAIRQKFEGARRVSVLVMDGEPLLLIERG